MDAKLLSRLKIWRDRQAMREGVETYRVLPNAALEAIAREKPSSKDGFFRIKGFKDAKWRRYGAMLVLMVMDAAGTAQPEEPFPTSSVPDPDGMPVTPPVGSGAQDGRGVASDDAYSVGSFLDLLNDSFAGLLVRIRGEVSSVDIRERVVYFTLKDPDGQSSLSCLIFRSRYEMSGVRMEVGQEIIVHGGPEIWKPSGRLSFKATLVELCGEGALKKAYDDLRKRLEGEGMFAPERKRPLPEFPVRIGLVTSRDGAAIGDFMTNIGRRGFRITLYPSSVEGQRAVPELLAALRWLARRADSFDALVIIRGGGSLESLQAFNNEALVRAIAASPIPVLAGIGHEKDVSLAALAADAMVSTPTAAARAVRESWDAADRRFDRAEQAMLSAFGLALDIQGRRIKEGADRLTGYLRGFRERFLRAEHRVRERFGILSASLRASRQESDRMASMFLERYASALAAVGKDIGRAERTLGRHDPERLLRLGYSLAFREGRLVRSTREVAPGDRLSVRLGDGEVVTRAESVLSDS